MRHSFILARFEGKLEYTLKNIQANLIFLARLFVYLIKPNILTLAVKNIQVNLILFCSLIRIFAANYYKLFNFLKKSEK